MYNMCSRTKIHRLLSRQHYFLDILQEQNKYKLQKTPVSILTKWEKAREKFVTGEQTVFPYMISISQNTYDIQDNHDWGNANAYTDKYDLYSLKLNNFSYKTGRKLCQVDTLILTEQSPSALRGIFCYDHPCHSLRFTFNLNQKKIIYWNKLSSLFSYLFCPFIVNYHQLMTS